LGLRMMKMIWRVLEVVFRRRRIEVVGFGG
jgi:hypothetical protein